MPRGLFELRKDSVTGWWVAVVVDRGTLHALAPSVDLIPGMPVEVLVVTERRTMIEYLDKPFHEALWRSFREI